MTFFLAAALVVMALISMVLGFTLYRHIRWTEVDFNLQAEPSSLRYTLNRMLDTMRRKNDWDSLDGMRSELKKALSHVDRMRHDAGNRELMESKPSRERAQEFTVIRGEVTSDRKATLAEAHGFLDACGLKPATVEWELALNGEPIDVDGAKIRFVPSV